MTADPELKVWKHTVDGVEREDKYLHFTLACDDGFRKDEEGKKTDTEFFRVTAWRGAAEAIAKYGFKGRTMTVTGAVHLKNYTSSNTTRYYMGIPNPWYFEFLGSNNKTEKAVPNDAPDDAPEAECPWDEV
jgi:single-stranded DNA-binding protein